jgi:AraC family transcriptional regulator of adaptative response/methylated-DNA-[protein]-cysteine methyltransferase
MEAQMNIRVADYRQLNEDYQRIEQAILYLEKNSRRQPELDEIASSVGLSEYHFQRLFTRWAGISPKRFLQFLTRENAKEMLDRSENILDTTLQVGLSSLGRLHDLFITTEAVTPGEYKSRGAGLTIRYGLHRTPFGECLIGVTERGICQLSFIQVSEAEALDSMVEYWKEARMIEDHSATASLIGPIFDVSEHGRQALHMFVRGSNFQIKVWEALMRIQPGSLSTYKEIADQIGQPEASRAVGNAVAHNPIAVLIPCHRVIRTLGEFGNYRYGTARKKALLVREFAMVETGS